MELYKLSIFDNGFHYQKHHKARHEVAIMDMSNWEFYVLSTDLINERLGDGRSVGLGRLRGLAEPVGYAELKGKLTDLVCQLRYQDSTGAVQRNVSS